ncbi:proline-rich protein PRCC-like [Saccoglossus kowalevskii]|uniref:Proline-rich protein PRCC-like n=1 Tax=Saccoglossus kowalevskii TaxID=10224 RepID=A0ABM0M1V5_SACKO|nr:PREDICTED: proline-rich protein PRCC-like [Saccoglossus kowalevskii]
MSLVNYGSSDESEGSDNEEIQPVTSSVIPLDSKASSSARSLLSSLPPPKTSNTIEVDSSTVSPQHSSGTMNLKKVRNTTTPVEKTTKSSSLSLPAPKKGQPVKITLPSMPEIDSDEDEPVVKKSKPVPQGTGLFALLPKPKHAVTKEHNRILIPHTLSRRPEKKPVSRKPQTVSLKKTTSNLIQAYDDDDDDDEPSSFFSFHEKTTERETQNIQTEIKTSAADDNDLKDTLSRTTGMESSQSSLQTTLITPQEKPLSFNVSSSDDTPLCFNPATPADGSLDFQHQTVSSTASIDKTASSQSMTYNVPYEYNVPYQEYTNQDYYQYSENAEQHVIYNNEQGQTSEQNYASDEGFKRIQGKKRKKEDIQIIDIQEDHSSYSTAEWLKTHIKEDDKQYMSKLRNEVLPTSQQRRKHQITYLAHQAKERELELKNSWAENKLTRRQTQAKYGF